MRLFLIRITAMLFVGTPNDTDGVAVNGRARAAFGKRNLPTPLTKYYFFARSNLGDSPSIRRLPSVVAAAAADPFEEEDGVVENGNSRRVKQPYSLGLSVGKRDEFGMESGQTGDAAVSDFASKTKKTSANKKMSADDVDNGLPPAPLTVTFSDGNHNNESIAGLDEHERRTSKKSSLFYRFPPSLDAIWKFTKQNSEEQKDQRKKTESHITQGTHPGPHNLPTNSPPPSEFDANVTSFTEETVDVPKQGFKSRLKKSLSWTKNHESSAKGNAGYPLLSTNMDRNAYVTLADLEDMLLSNNYVRRSDLLMESSSGGQTGSTTSNLSRGKIPQNEPKKKEGGAVAFPQKSVLTTHDVTVGTTISSSLLFLILAITISPSLWLVSGFVGALYGYEVSKSVIIDDKKPSIANNNTRTNAVATLVVNAGTKIATTYHTVGDFFEGMWFLYKTGQLSYDYYKRYAEMDAKFQIQDKIDAWNARFQQGKINFDKWEKENEVGRKVLAGLRTVLVLEEQSLKEGQKRYGTKARSKYRLVQYTRDVTSSVGVLLHAFWQVISGRGTSELGDIVASTREGLINLDFEVMGYRLGAAVAALLAVMVLSLLFSVIPEALGLLAVTMGGLYPTWVYNAFQYLRDIRREVDETKGRKKSSSSFGSKKKTGVVRYHYFVRDDGTKRWYRTGRQIFGRTQEKEEDLPRQGMLGRFRIFDRLSKKREKEKMR